MLCPHEAIKKKQNRKQNQKQEGSNSPLNMASEFTAIFVWLSEGDAEFMMQLWVSFLQHAFFPSHQHGWAADLLPLTVLTVTSLFGNFSFFSIFFSFSNKGFVGQSQEFVKCAWTPTSEAI